MAVAAQVLTRSQEYRVLTAQLESLFMHSSSFTLQTLYFHLHPTIHTMSLLASLCQSLEAEDSDGVKDRSDLSDDDDDEDGGLGGIAEKLGFGGAGLAGLMKNLKAQEGGGLTGGGGPVLGGEVLDTICERDATLSG